LAVRAQGDVTLYAAANDVDTVAINTIGLIELNDTDNLTVGSVTMAIAGLCFAGTVAGLVSSGGDINVQTGGGLFLNNGIDAGAGAVRLVAGSSINQAAGGAVLADALGILASGAVTLGAAPLNDVNTLAVSTSGLVEFRDADDLVIGGVTAGGNCGFSGATGIVSAGGDVNLRTAALLDVEQPINAGAGIMRLQVTGGGSPSITQSAIGVL